MLELGRRKAGSMKMIEPAVPYFELKRLVSRAR